MDPSEKDRDSVERVPGLSSEMTDRDRQELLASALRLSGTRLPSRMRAAFKMEIQESRSIPIESGMGKDAESVFLVLGSMSASDVGDHFLQGKVFYLGLSEFPKPRGEIDFLEDGHTGRCLCFPITKRKEELQPLLERLERVSEFRKKPSELPPNQHRFRPEKY